MRRKGGILMRIACIAVLLWLAVISVVSAIISIYDKIAAKKLPKRRIPEKTLLIFGALGGAAAMYFTMLLIRHKTQHAKFMLGLPAMLVAHLLLASAAVVLIVIH